MDEIAVEHPPGTVVDARGRACPIPVIDLAAAVEAAEVGATVQLLADDPGAKVDIPVWCRMKGARLDRVEELDTEGRAVFRFTVTKV